jgi:hypothetical protein
MSHQLPAKINLLFINQDKSNISSIIYKNEPFPWFMTRFTVLSFKPNFSVILKSSCHQLLSNPHRGGGSLLTAAFIIHQECRTTREQQQKDWVISNNSYLLSKSMLYLTLPFYADSCERDPIKYSNVHEINLLNKGAGWLSVYVKMNYCG